MEITLTPQLQGKSFNKWSATNTLWGSNNKWGDLDIIRFEYGFHNDFNSSFCNSSTIKISENQTVEMDVINRHNGVASIKLKNTKINSELDQHGNQLKTIIDFKTYELLSCNDEKLEETIKEYMMLEEL